MKLTTAQQEELNNLKPYQSNYFSLMPKVDMLFDYLRSQGINALQREEPKDDDLRPFAYYDEEVFGGVMMESGKLYVNFVSFNPSVLEALKEGCNQANLLYDFVENEEYGNVMTIYEAKTWIEPSFTLEQEYELFPPLETKENLKSYYGDLLACIDDDYKPSPEDIAWLKKKLTDLGLKEDIKYLEDITS